MKVSLLFLIKKYLFRSYLLANNPIDLRKFQKSSSGLIILIGLIKINLKNY